MRSAPGIARALGLKEGGIFHLSSISRAQGRAARLRSFAMQHNEPIMRHRSVLHRGCNRLSMMVRESGHARLTKTKSDPRRQTADGRPADERKPRDVDAACGL